MIRCFPLVIAIIWGCTSPNKDASISIDVWYGDNQIFGTHGISQQWVNILGNVNTEKGIASLTYSLNGATEKSLTPGSDLNRLASPGDFNIDIDVTLMKQGENELVIHALDSLDNEVNKALTVQVDKSKKWPLPYTVDWSTVKEIQEVVQVVDGNWEITEDGLHNIDTYYDRVVAFGDSTWKDYEIQTTVVFHSFTKPESGPPTYNVSHVAIASRWPGHDLDTLQPHRKWYPLGATSEFRLTEQLDSCRWRIFDGPKPYATRFYVEQSSDKYREIALNKKYGVKHRVETIDKNTTKYSAKMWPMDQPEPEDWDLIAIENDENIFTGSALLIAHHTNVTFGNIHAMPIKHD